MSAFLIYSYGKKQMVVDIREADMNLKVVSGEQHIVFVAIEYPS